MRGQMLRETRLTILITLTAFLLIGLGEVYRALYDPSRTYPLGVAHLTVLAYLLAYALAAALVLSLAISREKSATDSRS